MRLFIEYLIINLFDFLLSKVETKLADEALGGGHQRTWTLAAPEETKMLCQPTIRPKV